MTQPLQKASTQAIITQQTMYFGNTTSLESMVDEREFKFEYNKKKKDDAFDRSGNMLQLIYTDRDLYPTFSQVSQIQL